jgi:hypothetical protein
METKQCTKCGRILPISEFQLNNKTPDGLTHICKNCSQKGKKKKNFQLYEKGNENSNPLLKDFTPRELIQELRIRGYKGELTFIQTIKI